MYVVKTRDPEAAIERLADIFTNFYLGSLAYKNGKKLAKPVPGFPKITSVVKGVEFGVRFNSDLHLVCPITQHSGLNDAFYRIISNIVTIVTERTKKSLVPVPQHRGHHYTKPPRVVIRFADSASWMNGPEVPGVFWDYTDCLSAEDGDTVVTPSLSHFKRGSMLTDRKVLRYAAGAVDPCAINNQQKSYADHLRMGGTNRTVRCTPKTDPIAADCNNCGHILHKLAFQLLDGEHYLCLICRMHRGEEFIAHELSDVRNAHTSEILEDPEQKEMLDDLRIAKSAKTSNKTTILVGKTHVFARSPAELVYCESIPEIEGKKLIPVRIFDIVKT